MSAFWKVIWNAAKFLSLTSTLYRTADNEPHYNKRVTEQTNNNMSKYTFQTIVATAEIRAAFTQMRNELSSSDKELMSAIWQVVTDNAQSVVDALDAIRAEKAVEKTATKEAKKSLAAKKAPKKASKKTAKKAKVEKPEPKAKKVKGNRPVKDVVRMIESTDDEPPITVADGRQ
jgi:DNA replication initiation complex subunit (GINS family)